MKNVLAKIKSKDFQIVIIPWLLIILLTYFSVWVGAEKVSYTNLMYDSAPWSVYGVAGENSYASDVVDSVLTNVYAMYYGEGYSTWNSDIGFGMSIGPEIYLNPLNWVYFLPLDVAMFLLSFLRITIAYFGMIYLLRRYKLDVFACVLGGVSYGLSSSIMMWHFWPHSFVMAYAPFAIAFAEEIISGGANRLGKYIIDVIKLGIVVFLMLVAEMPTYAAYILYLIGFYMLCVPLCIGFADRALLENSTGNLVDGKRNAILGIFAKWIKFFAAVLIGVVGAAPYLLGLKERVVSNGYASGRTEEAFVAHNISNIKSLLFNFYGTYDADINEVNVYIGAVALVLLFFTFIRFREKRGARLLFWCVYAVLLIMLCYTHIFDNIFAHVPAIHSSLKTRLVSLLPLVLTIIAAVNVSDVLKNREIYASDKARFVPYAAGIVLLALFVKGFDWSSISHRSLIYDWEILAGVFTVFAVIVFIFGIELYVRGAFKDRFIGKAIAPAIIFATVLNTTAYARDWVPMQTSNGEALPEATDTIRFLQDNTENERVYIIGEWTLFPNTNTIYDIKSVSAHSFANTNADIREYLLGVDANCFATRTNVRGTGVDNLNLLKYAGVKYIVTETGQEIAGTEVPVPTVLEQAYSGSDGLTVYELKEYADRFYLTDLIIPCATEAEVLDQMKKEYYDGAAFVTEGTTLAALGTVLPVTGSEPFDCGEADNETSEQDAQETSFCDSAVMVREGSTDDDITLDVAVAENRVLVFNEYNDGRWKAYVDGEEVSIYKVNYLFNGVIVEKGVHEVRFVRGDKK